MSLARGGRLPKASIKIMHVSLTGLAACFFLLNPAEASKATSKITGC
jgi:hypothetical protein